MKNLGRIVKVAVLLVMLVLSCVATGMFLGVHPFVVAAVSLSIYAFTNAITGYVPTIKRGNAFMAVNLNQLLVADLLQIFKNIKDDFMADLKDYSGAVNNDVIKFNDIGADPNVLVNNSTYPIQNVTRTDVGVPVSLFKLETENTKITAAEYHALPYDKNSSVMDAHVRALKEARVKLGLHSLAPNDNSNAKTPVLKTTGASTDSGRLRLTIQDIINFKTLVDKNEDPETRKLVLCSDHVNDILSIDNVFRDRYYNIAPGQLITRLLGFDIYENIRTPKFNPDLTKKAYGAAALGTDKSASVYFNTANAMKAIGSANVYYRDKSLDPENRQTVIGFDMYYIISPVSTRGYGAIVDGDATT